MHEQFTGLARYQFFTLGDLYLANEENPIFRSAEVMIWPIQWPSRASASLLVRQEFDQRPNQQAVSTA
jgi:hypothetical protein